jgi:PIN domain nuclease of toxin-antitoxin system
MRALLDTQIFLWWINQDQRLSRECSEIIADASNEILFSAVSGWEIAIKASRGRLSLPDDTEPYILAQVSLNHFEALPIGLNHALRVHHLPDHHKDPFDRMLVAQAQIEELALLSADPQIARYAVKVIR